MLNSNENKEISGCSVNLKSVEILYDQGKESYCSGSSYVHPTFLT
jgi:hypothetical protein